MSQLDLFQKEEIISKRNYKPESYTGIYALHKYWSKKPHNIIRNFIIKYSNSGDIVLDPFCGSGISVIEAIFSHRKAIGIDINPISVFITQQLLKKISTKRILHEFEKIKSDVKEKINHLYMVKRGNKNYIGTHFIWQENTLIEVWYVNKNGKKFKTVDIPTLDDVNLAKSFSYTNIPFYYPQKKFFHNPRINAFRTKYIYELFTPRNLLALSILMSRIEKIDNKDTQDLFKFVFTSSVGQASKMVFVVKKRGKYKGTHENVPEKKEVGSWVIGYWVPKEYFEINVWNCFENRLRKTLKAKSNQYNKSYTVKKAKTFNDLNYDKNLLLINEPAQKALTKFPGNSIDYIITDPPHGNRQPYLELSMMWNDWLKNEVNYEDEIVISESKDRNKDANNYFHLLNITLEEMVRVLKPHKYFSLMFNSLDDNTWINLINKMNGLRLELQKVETLAYSANSVVQDTRKKGLKTDFIITFQKNPNRAHRKLELISIAQNRNLIINKIVTYLSEANNNELETYQIVNLLFSDLLYSNRFIKLSDLFKILEENFKSHKNKWKKKD